MVVAERIGSTFESFLEEEGIANEVYALAEEKIRKAREQSNVLSSLPPTPVPPKTLFRQIERISLERPQCFRMSTWHATPGGFPLDLRHVDKLDMLRDCNTRHCLAGWINTLTEGGLEFERFVARSGVSQLALQNALRETSMPPCPLAPSATVALTLLRTLGWLETKGDSKAFDPTLFYSIDEDMRPHLRRLAREEAERFPDVPFAA